jgi:serine/threonine protein phosphatase PrpC
LTSDGLIDAQTDASDLYREYIRSDKDEEVAQEVLDAVVTGDLIRDVVLEADTLEQGADRLVTLSNEKGGKDNISIIMFADETLPNSPDPGKSGLPERSVDPPEPIEGRETVIR